VVRDVAARVTSATGDAGASQRVAQPISLRNARHTLCVFVFRGCPTRSARWTTDRSDCAKGPLCVAEDSYPNRMVTAWIERRLQLKAVVHDGEIIG